MGYQEAALPALIEGGRPGAGLPTEVECTLVVIARERILRLSRLGATMGHSMDGGGFVELLREFRGPAVFNQYAEVDPALDLPGADRVRRQNLVGYLSWFAGARFLLVGEAAGYAGCRFSGIPFTCEAQLVGPDRLRWVAATTVARSSSSERPWSERSAAIVWQAIATRGDCLLWNACPWHPYSERGPLSNRRPATELKAGIEVLGVLLALLPAAQPVAVGRVAQEALRTAGVHAPYVRHPSHGGKRAFLAEISALD